MAGHAGLAAEWGRAHGQSGSCFLPRECRGSPADAALEVESKNSGVRGGRAHCSGWASLPPCPWGEQYPVKTTELVALKTADHLSSAKSVDTLLKGKKEDLPFSPSSLRIETKDPDPPQQRTASEPLETPQATHGMS